MTPQASKHQTHAKPATPCQDLWPSNQPAPSPRPLPVSGHTASLLAHGTSRVTLNIPTTLIERLRNAVYWTERTTLARVISDALHDAVAEMEQANGGVFPPRLTPLKPGRPRRVPRTPRHPSVEPTL